jgi:murein DD-endopeptidase MepM/ murein hydrolase activator NlpD
MRTPLDRMRLRSLYGDKNETLQTHGSTYGKVRDGGSRAHQGWDLAAVPGTPVYAISNGIICHAQAQDHKNMFDHGAKYGRHILMWFSFNQKEFYAFYAHLQELSVHTGDAVTEGDSIGLTGRSGLIAKKLPMDQAHLHFEVRTVARSIPGLKTKVDPHHFFSLPAGEDQCFLAPLLSS